MNPEGWYLDPFEVHELRWFSAGTPTDLVRDEDVEAYEAPPAETWTGELTPYQPAPSSGEEAGGDLLRADADAAEVDDYDPAAAADAALDRAAASGLGFS